jgi:hypothetical protein
MKDFLFEINFENDMKLIEKYCNDNNIDVCNMSAADLKELIAILIKDKFEKTFGVELKSMDEIKKEIRKDNNKK